MDYFNYQNKQLYAEQVPVIDIAERFGTPCYVYSRATLERHYRVFDEAFGDQPHRICYSVKANGNLALLNVLARLGSGFDIVSGGELERVLKAGGKPKDIVFSGMGKLEWEMNRALEVGIGCFNVESEGELARLNRLAGEQGKIAPIAIRVNPDVDPKTHPYIATGLRENKFGVPMDVAEALYQQAQGMAHVHPIGVDCHIGSQLTELQPLLDAFRKVIALVDRLRSQGMAIHHVDLGGGLGVRYRNEHPPTPAEYTRALLPLLPDKSLELVLEPGRAIAANAGMLLTRVEYLKAAPGKHFAVIDAAMNDLLRPALYDAWHDIVPAVMREDLEPLDYDVVGPVCETGDFLGKQRSLAIAEGDVLAVRTAGAYGFVMSSNYNARPRAAEVMVDGADVFEVRSRETVSDLFRSEKILP